MTWRKYFTPVAQTGQLSPISGGSSASPSRTNYSSFLPDVYSGHPNRLERYSQYDTMDSDPEVNAALDILAEFCTQLNDDNSTPFNIYFREKATSTEIKIIKRYLQQWCKLNKFSTRMFKIVRNAFKYGDSFFIRDPETLSLFYIDPSKIDKIIVNESDGKEPEQYVIRDLNINFQNLTVTQINPSNQTTTPGGTTYVTGGAHQRGMVGAYPQSVGSRFGNSQNQTAIDAKHIVHLSMSEGLDNNFPFGNSLLECIFKVYKQKELLEDAIIIYRIQRAPERRIFYIDVGNMPSHLAMSFVERVKQEVNQRRIPSLTGGGCFSMDTRVPLLDGRVLSIAELATEYNEGKENWAYSCDPSTGSMAPGIISWAGVTQESAEVIELELDNGEKITCTPEHKFPVHGKGFVEAKDIVVGEDSLFSFNTRSVPLDNRKKSSDYTQVYDHKKKDWVFTHRAVANFFKDAGLHTEMTYSEDYLYSRKTVIHHADFNRYNNSPTNLAFMYYVDHIKYHGAHAKEMIASRTPEESARIRRKINNTINNWSDEQKASSHQIRSTASKNVWEKLRNNPEQYQERIHQLIPNLTFNKEPWQNQRLQFSRELFDIFCNAINTPDSSLKTALSVINDNKDFMDLYQELNQPREKMIYKLIIDRFTNDTLMAMLAHFGFSSWGKFLKSRNKLIQRPSRKLKWDNTMLKMVVDEVVSKKLNSIPATVAALQENTSFMSKFALMNATIKGNATPGKFTQNTFKVFINDAGFDNWVDFKKKLPLFNHKVVSIRPIVTPMQVGTLTIDNDEKYHNYHTFAIEQGIYTKNSSVIDSSYNPLAVGDDYFFPTTSEGRGSKVDTLPGGCFAMDTKVSLLDGRELSIREIEEEMKTGKVLWTYSCDPNTGKIVPGLISWAGVTHKSAKVMRITLDSGESVVCTPDHPFVTRHNGFAEARTLMVGDSLMPLYRRKEQLYKSTDGIYEQFFDNESNKWQFTHRMVADYLRGTVVKEWVYKEELNNGKFTTRHHKNFNRYDNSPENLCFMNSKDHITYHSDHSASLWETLKNDQPERYANILQHKSELATAVWLTHTPEEYEQRCARIGKGIVSYVENLSPEEREIRAQDSRDAFKIASIEFNHKMKNDPAFYAGVVGQRMKYWTPENRQKRGAKISEIQVKQWADPEYAAKYREDHKERQLPLFSENMLKFVIDKVHGKTSHQVNALDIVVAMNQDEALVKELYDLNFQKSIPNWSGKFTPSMLKMSMMRHFGYSNWADFRRKESVHNHRIAKIEYLDDEIEVGTLTIDGEELIHGYHTFALSIGIQVKNSNLGEISDLLFFTQKLMRALRIPSSYLPTGIDDSQASFNDGRVGTAYIQELRFNKYCERLQSLINDKFDSEFKLYLSKKGINIDFNLFDLQFNPPQNFAAYRQAEMDNARVTVYGSISAVPHISKRFALKRFLGLTPEEIAENEQLWREENVDSNVNLGAQAELRSAGVTTAGLAGDLSSLEQASVPPEGMEMEQPMEPVGAAPGIVPPVGGTTPQI